MDPAAAIASLITFSVQSAKVIYQVLQIINVGHDTVTRSVAIKVDKLRYDLERFEKCPTGKFESSPELKQLLENCRASLEGMHKKLQKLQLISSDKLPTKLWKSFRAATNDSELKKFQTDVESFSIQLSTHLGISTNEKVFEIYDTATDNHAVMLREFSNLNASLGEIKGTVVDLFSSPQRFESPCYPRNSYAEFDGFHISPAVCRWTTELIGHNSQTLEIYFNKDRLCLKCSSPPSVGLQTLIWLQEWIQVDSSSGLWWLRGPPGMSRDVDNQTTQISAKLVELAALENVHMISYFCPRVSPGGTGNMQALTSLLYALLRQIIILVPLQLHLANNIDFSEHRFQQLDGTAERWIPAISILRDLMALIPQTEKTYCILDGFNWVDKVENRELVEELLKIFQEARLNVLFATTGRSECLVRTIKGKRNLDIQFVPGGQVDLGQSGRGIWGARKT